MCAFGKARQTNLIFRDFKIFHEVDQGVDAF